MTSKKKKNGRNMVRRGENVSTGAPLVRLVGLVILSLPEPVGAK